MPYVKKKRPYKKEYQQQKQRKENKRRAERQRARRKIKKSLIRITMVRQMCGKAKMYRIEERYPKVVLIKMG